MTRINIPELDEYERQWDYEPRLPLYVHRYTDDDTVEWEIYYDQAPTCGVPIASFTSWAEAVDYAFSRAESAYYFRGVIPRRYNLTYRPDGSWGEMGYYEADMPDWKHI